MGVVVQNVTGSTALVIWPKMASCTDSFYSIMYNPNWDKMLTGYTRKYFQKEERVPASRSSFVIENLIPLTTYILCVTCQSANPSSDQCRIFNTLKQDPASTSNKKKELAVGIWLTSSVLLLIIVGILVYGCMHLWWRRRREGSEGQSITTENKGEAWGKSESCSSEEFNKQVQSAQGVEIRNADGVQLATIIENPLTSKKSIMLGSKSQDFVPMSVHQSATS
ncbi:fibronectin type III domain-containing protein 9 [Hemicordylus capensis]|uniref:fibronectin type III domain-containing protein 9 n=1 Tax=Hemicordylus capensis TaxID=884348 RepID=UPI0023046D46|nr:fibronectin type III domain-containing protein 9 [Hemicordylus capensis]XP_053162766.1 fibronectin type III domain-containing protein 9 [Hemicordylus capensis]XP_053162767.1 fibronectin type III domain-containing protein 9 [Hemicordylus capensis]XP_053162768.1 fibronectin type III domain-containing protein 9 [Hemicordylus capensis]XP_053162769.1 fibronectin type III domain-containing protein 9 [Hemicordylus capensis]